jgi:asparagine synthetase B (glutamine-hydrolysing)
MKIHLTPLEMINALRFGYHKIGHPQEYIIDERLGISEYHARSILQDRICSVIENLKTPITVLVSGGVDSSFILQMARECFPDSKIVTVGMNYPAAQHNIESKREWVDETLDLINEYTYRSLFFSSSLVVTQNMYKIARRYGETILTGDGGDELFCGYDKYLLPDISLGSIVGRKGKKFLNYLSLGYEGAMTTPLDLSLFKTGYIKEKQSRMLYDISTELKHIEIPKTETAMRMSQTEDLVCSPFLEKEVFTFCMSLPLKYKYHWGIRKVLLRKILKDRGIKISHKKKGFALPSEWISNELNWSLMVLNRLMIQGMVEITS